MMSSRKAQPLSFRPVFMFSSPACNWMFLGHLQLYFFMINTILNPFLRSLCYKDERMWTTPVPIKFPCTGNSFAFDALKESEGKAGLPIGLAVDLLHSVLPRLEHLLNLLPQEVDVPLGETGGKFMAGVVKSITIQSVQFFLLWCNNFWGCSKGYDNSQI